MSHPLLPYLRAPKELKSAPKAVQQRAEIPREPSRHHFEPPARKKRWRKANCRVIWSRIVFATIFGRLKGGFARVGSLLLKK